MPARRAPVVALLTLLQRRFPGLDDPARPIKLAHALTAFGINATGAVALDLGAAGDGGLAIMALTWCHHD